MGYVRYNDVFENEYVRGFCLRFAPEQTSIGTMTWTSPATT
jgi:hypothetical protein